jgi:hypothetical protein
VGTIQTLSDAQRDRLADLGILEEVTGTAGTPRPA